MQDNLIITDAQQAALLMQPVKARILDSLNEPATTAELAKRFDQPRQRLGYHVRQLEQAGLIQVVDQTRNRNCLGRRLQAIARKFYVAPDAAGEDLADHDALAAEIRDRFSSSWLIGQSARAVREVAELSELARAANKKLPTLSLDSVVSFDNAEDQEAFAQELTELLAALVSRYDSDGQNARQFRLLSACYPRPVERPADTSGTQRKH